MKYLIVILLVAVLPVLAPGQTRLHTGARYNNLPAWAAAHKYDASAHAYFPDYYTYYDPKRKGYVYWNKGKYVFTPALPPFMEKVDMSKTRLKILKGLSLDLHPELNYPYYMQLYPPDPNNHILVPVPTQDNPAAR